MEKNELKNKEKSASSWEPRQTGITTKLNWLRAAVLGANDGIVSISGLVLGVAAATESVSIIFTAGLAGIISGAISMAAGEYVSVSSSRDTERALISKEKEELEHHPKEEFDELVELYKERGLTSKTAKVAAKEFTQKNAITAHLESEYKVDPNELTSPWHAAFASSASFLVGAIIPLAAILVPPAAFRVPVTFTAIITALIVTGAISGKVSGSNIIRAITRVVIGGLLAMTVTYAIGKIFGIDGM